ncbi:uncharacterized protein LOC123561165 [Mercenaria mercenaria]|uniref:uncharacterized protein LOC123561165 n=1 Tax=Mercenaria mercenaria TaxID=6596 RepID=UPI001E1D4ED3|nr:uncharacterized protein LOC123561165 [Mercenaria mercenaria]
MSNVTGSNQASPETGDKNSSEQGFDKNFPIYVGIAIGAGIFVCLVIIVVILLYKKGTFRKLRRRESGSSTRRLYFRGFSTVSQRGAIDSTAEFEIVNTMSVSSEDGGDKNRKNSKSEMVPKKPERKRTRTSSNNVKYENVTLDTNAGFVVRKSVSMSSGIPYIDNTLESRISEKDEDLDDVFH